jgi:hypothetical protein
MCRPWFSPALAIGVAEQAPEELLAALTTFLAPYRDGPTGSTSISST